MNSALDLKFQLIKFKYISNLFVSAEEWTLYNIL